MNNKDFEININPETGFVTSIVFSDDMHHMNWCAGDGCWGKVFSGRRCGEDEQFRYAYEEMSMKSFFHDESSCEISYSDSRLLITVNRCFTPDGKLREIYKMKNITAVPVSITPDNFGIEIDLNDRYTCADECITKRCHTHIWCGHNFSYINALRMGSTGKNLGLILTDGVFECYSQNDCQSNTRGKFVFHTESMILNPGCEYSLAWDIFRHDGTEDFENVISGYENSIIITAKHYTVFEGENIEFNIRTNSSLTEVRCNAGEVEAVLAGDGVYRVCFKPGLASDYRFTVTAGEKTTHADFTVKPAFSELVKKRIDFIVSNQQCLDKSSPLYGAYLIYDNKTETQYFDNSFHDHNAGRERLGMSLLIARYLQSEENPGWRKSLDLCIEFVLRELWNEETGEVYNTIGRNQNFFRLYNAAWVMMLFAEMYYLSKDKEYLLMLSKTSDYFFTNGGIKFYPVGLEPLRILGAFKSAGMESEYQKVFEYFKHSTVSMISTGLSYPKHEVNYEQSIVAPAATYIAQMGIETGEHEYYSKNVRNHIECLTRFAANQPSFHLNEISVRYWDDFWFGKSMMFGDVYPHYWSVLNARAFLSYAGLTGDDTFKIKAEEVLRNCLCLFDNEGRGSCAYVYPYWLDGKKGEFFDEWANDQDFALYFALLSSDELEIFNSK